MLKQLDTGKSKERVRICCSLCRPDIRRKPANVSHDRLFSKSKVVDSFHAVSRDREIKAIIRDEIAGRRHQISERTANVSLAYG